MFNSKLVKQINNRVPGSTMVEYTLVGALCLVVCIGGLKLLAEGVNGGFSDFASHLVLGPVDVNQPKGPTTSVDTLANLRTALDTHFVELSDQEKELLQNDAAQKIAALGANGTTDLLSREIAMLAQSLQATGELTEDQGGLLQQLANKGHEMAQVERLIEDAIATNQSGPLTYQGEAYTVKELTQLVGYSGASPSTLDDPFNPNVSAGPMLDEYRSLYQQAEQSGVLASAQVKSLVSTAASQIMVIGETVEDSFIHYKPSKTGPKESEAIFKENLASKATNMYSKRICKTGGHSDNGILCKNQG